MCLDGTLIETTRSSARSETEHGLWYSGKHRAHGGNIQVLTDPSGFPVWTSPVEPGSTHDITAARAHTLGALYPAATAGMPTLADKGYTGAGIGVHVPTNGANVDKDNRARNLLLSKLRPPAERQRPAEVHLEDATPYHRLPPPNRRHHRRRTRPAHHATRPLMRKPQC